MTESPEGWRLESEAAWEAALNRLQSNMIESVLSNCVKQIKARAKSPGR
jgi:DNA-binding FrmR family transcriptional regulator